MKTRSMSVAEEIDLKKKQALKGAAARVVKADRSHRAYTRRTKGGKMVQVGAKGSPRDPKADELHAHAYEHLSHQVPAFHKNVARKMAAGNYDHDKAKKLWGYMADRAAQHYHKHHNMPGKWHEHFPKGVREQAASSMADEARDYIDKNRGEFAEDVPKKHREAWVSEGEEKKHVAGMRSYRERRAKELEASGNKERAKQFRESSKRVERNRMKKSDNDNDVDIDADHGDTGIADYGGQVAMRVAPNSKCRTCTHYDENVSVCSIGVVPDVCGDGTYPEIGFAPVDPNRIAAKNWVARHKDAVAAPAQAEDIGYEGDQVPYRVEVLGDSSLALSERMTLVKAAVKNKDAVIAHIWHHTMSEGKRQKYRQKDPKYRAKSPKQKAAMEGHGKPPKAFFEHMRQKLGKADGWHDPAVMDAVEALTGVPVRVPMLASLHKGRMSIDEFADAIGTTEDVVRSIARTLGDKQRFAQFVKSKLPDIRMAHGLSEQDVVNLFRAAERTVKSLSDTEWAAWKGYNFDNEPEDTAIARAIEQNGLMDHNAIMHGSVIVTPAHVPYPAIPSEPIQDPTSQPVAPSHSGGPMNINLADVRSR